VRKQCSTLTDTAQQYVIKAQATEEIRIQFIKRYIVIKELVKMVRKGLFEYDTATDI